MPHELARPATCYSENQTPPAFQVVAQSEMLQTSIPYGEIDCEIRHLVQLMNAMPGITTLFSCAGHTDDEQTYVTFTAADYDAFATFVRALPFHGVKGSLIANHFEHTILSVTSCIDANSRLVHNLHIGGCPRYAQRQLLGAVEAALTVASRVVPSRP